MSEFSEEDRLAALRSYGVLDTPVEAAFDEIAQAAAKFCGVPMSAVSLVDATRQWFKAEVGLGVRETPRDVSFCKHAMLGSELYVVADAREDPLFAHNALVTGDPNVRFYAGAPIKTPQGVPLGALCVIDSRARPEGLTEDQANLLRVLARQVEAQLELRRVVETQAALARQQTALMAAAVQREEKLVSALESAQVGWWEWNIATGMVVGSADFARDRHLGPDAVGEGVSLETIFSRIHPGDLPWLKDALDEAVKTGDPFREEYRLVGPQGQISWTSSRGQCLRDADGKPWRFPGVAIDITDRKMTERRLREADMGRELAMQAAQLGRFDHNPSTGERFYDARALEMLGLTPEEASDQEVVLGHVHPENREALMADVAAATDANRSGPFRHTYRAIRPRTGEECWISVIGQSQFSDGVCTRFMGVFEDVTQAKLAEEHRRLLTNELNHRMKNTLALVVSLVSSSLRNASDVSTVKDEINGRILALSQANDLLTAENWSAASVPDIVQGVAQSLSLPPGRLELDGEAVRLGPRPALQLALALHELATNAVKYGALSNDTGKVSMCWRLSQKGGDGDFTFSWTERGGPTVAPPTRKGFGSRLIQQATESAFSGQVEIDYLPAGVCWRLRAPMAGLAELGRHEA